MSRTCIVIPTYNEAENLPKLVEVLEEELQREDFKVIVVDDNSQDGTANIAEELNRYYGNILIHRRLGKLGIGSAIRDGLKVALSFSDCKYIVTMDADLSHDPKDVVRLLKNAEDVYLVQGSRYIKEGKIIGWSFSRRTVSYFANLLCRLLLRTHLHEHTTYFRVYSRKCAEAIVENVCCNGYEWAIASILVAKDRNFKIKEVPITFTSRIRGKSKLKPYDIFKWTAYISKMFFKHCLNLQSRNNKPGWDKSTQEPINDAHTRVSKELRQPFVSIIVPTMNCQKTIKSLLDSILALTYKNYEVIVIDSSTDNTPLIVHEYIQRHSSRFNLISAPPAGLNVARNIGVKSAKGQIIAFVDGDCKVHPLWLAEIVNDFSAEIGAVGGSVISGDTNSNFWADYFESSLYQPMPKFPEKKVLSTANFHRQRPTGNNMAIRKELYEENGQFDESYKGGYDEVDFLWRLCLAGYKIVCEPNALVYHFHRTSFKRLIKQVFNYGKGCGRFCRKFPDAPLSRIRKRYLFAGLILAMVTLVSLVLSLVIHSWFTYLPLIAIGLPMVPSIPHCVVLLFNHKRISYLFYPFLDFFIYGITYHLGILFGIFYINLGAQRYTYNVG